MARGVHAVWMNSRVAGGLLRRSRIENRCVPGIVNTCKSRIVNYRRARIRQARIVHRR